MVALFSLPMADLSPTMQWVVLGVAVLSTAFVMFRPKFKAKKRDPLERSPGTVSLSQQRSVERQMENLLVELSEMYRQISASLDTRAARLDQLIREADTKIAQLQRAALLAPIPTSPSDSGQMPERSPADRFTSTSNGNDDKLGDMPPPSPYDADPRHAEVYALADRGDSPADIAAKLQRPAGEIQLILALRSRQS